MWEAQFNCIGPETTRYTVHAGPQSLSFGDVIELWIGDQAFRTFFTSVIASSPFDSFFWETPPVDNLTLARTFEFVLIQSRSLEKLEADPARYRSDFSSRAAETVISFPNLGGDAILVVPAPLAQETVYAHFSRFLRMAPKSQIDQFWQKAGMAMKERLSARPTWLSTAGMGVSWLHLRLDARPKYYRYKPYRDVAPGL